MESITLRKCSLGAKICVSGARNVRVLWQRPAVYKEAAAAGEQRSSLDLRSPSTAHGQTRWALQTACVDRTVHSPNRAGRSHADWARCRESLPALTAPSQCFLCCSFGSPCPVFLRLLPGPVLHSHPRCTHAVCVLARLIIRPASPNLRPPSSANPIFPHRARPPRPPRTLRLLPR